MVKKGKISQTKNFSKSESQKFFWKLNCKTGFSFNRSTAEPSPGQLYSPLLNIENMNGNFLVSAVCFPPTLLISPICGYNSAFHYDSFWISALNSSTFISDKFRTSDSFEWIPTFRKRRQLGEWENFFGTLQHDTAWHLSHRTLSGTLPTKSANFSASPIGSIGSFDRWLKASVIRILLLTCCSFIS